MDAVIPCGGRVARRWLLGTIAFGAFLGVMGTGTSGVGEAPARGAEASAAGAVGVGAGAAGVGRAVAGAAAAGAPGGVPTPEAVRDGLRRHLESLRVPGAPPGRYRPAPGGKPTLLASCDVVFLRWIVGDLPGDAVRKAWTKEIQSHQNPATGEWPGGLHRFGMACRALNMLGGKHAHPLRFLKRFEDPEVMERWLDARDWRNPWGASIEVLHVATPRVLSGRADPAGSAWADRFFSRLEAHQDPRTGLWGTDVGASTWEGMGGAFHFFPIYRAGRRPVPRAELMLGNVMSLGGPDGSFRGGYGRMDACHMLRALKVQVKDSERTQQADEALRGVLEGLLKTWDPGAGVFQGARDLHDLVAIYQTVIYTASARPNHPLARLEWRDAWSPELWKVDLP